MNRIEQINSVYYRVKLPHVLTDSTHGEMAYFELVTVRITDSDGAEGVEYTYAVNHGGASIHAMIDRDLSGHLTGEDPGRIEALWEKMVHDLHVHLLASVPNKSYLEVHGFGLERYIADPLSIEDGWATAPDTPGHGVVFDWEALENMRI